MTTPTVVSLNFSDLEKGHTEVNVTLGSFYDKYMCWLL